MSTPGPERTPSTVKVDKTSGQGKPPAAKKTAAKKTAARPAGSRPGAGKGGGKGKKITPVKVSGGRNWGPIAVAGVVVLIAIGSADMCCMTTRMIGRFSPRKIR